MPRPAPPPIATVDDVLRRALHEDLGEAGDLTSNALIDEDEPLTGRIVARAPGTIAGLEAGLRVFDLAGGRVDATQLVTDGESVRAETVLAEVEGSARTILTGERSGLNLLGHLSGIATATRALVDAVAGTNARVADTRKTTPGLRALEKYAVRCGGGTNHRFGLGDAVMIKDNHIAASSSIADAVARARAAIGHTVVVEVEVDRLDQIGEAVKSGADVIMLDNMGPEQLREAVEMIGGRTVTEASGSITISTVAEIAATGVDIISVGWITHSAPRLDVALDVL